TLYALITAACFFLVPANQILADNAPRAPALTSSVDDPGRIPYQFSPVSSSLCGQQAGVCSVILPDIPLGKRLVIQRWAFNSFVLNQNAGTAIAELLVTRNNVQNQVSFGTISSVSLFGAQWFTFDQPTQAYADPGNVVNFIVDGDPSAGNFQS